MLMHPLPLPHSFVYQASRNSRRKLLRCTAGTLPRCTVRDFTYEQYASAAQAVTDVLEWLSTCSCIQAITLSATSCMTQQQQHIRAGLQMLQQPCHA